MVLIIIVSKQKNKIKNSVLICYNNIQAIVRHLYGAQPYLSEPHFVAITRTCGLPRYMNIALFRRIDFMHQRDERITLDQFAQYVKITVILIKLNIHTFVNYFFSNNSGWTELSRDRYDDESLFFNILRKPNCAWLLPEDFLPVLEGKKSLISFICLFCCCSRL